MRACVRVRLHVFAYVCVNARAHVCVYENLSLSLSLSLSLCDTPSSLLQNSVDDSCCCSCEKKERKQEAHPGLQLYQVQHRARPDITVVVDRA